jgi:ABC-2 type transport system ATP-binding protein
MTIFQAQNLSQRSSRSSFHLRLDEISLSAGSITGVVGENGNGKTTFLDIAAGESKGDGKYYHLNSVDEGSNNEDDNSHQEVFDDSFY